MREISSGSVRIFWLDRSELLDRLKQAVEELSSRHPEVEQVVLFGSLARNEAVPGSDADLLLVLTDCSLAFADRGAVYRFPGLDIAVDLIAYTRDELDRMQADDNPFIKSAFKEGIVLLDRRAEEDKVSDGGNPSGRLQ